MNPAQTESAATPPESPAESPENQAAARSTPPQGAPVPLPPKEIGGRDGPEPTRFGDWEKSGRCIDF